MHYTYKTQQVLLGVVVGRWPGRETNSSACSLVMDDFARLGESFSFCLLETVPTTVRSPWKNGVCDSFTCNHLVLCVLRKVKNECLTKFISIA